MAGLHYGLVGVRSFTDVGNLFGLRSKLAEALNGDEQALRAHPLDLRTISGLYPNFYPDSIRRGAALADAIVLL